MGRRKALNFIVEAVAENPVGKGRRRGVGAVAPAHDGAMRRAAHIPPVAADDGGQFLHRPGGHISHPVQNGDFCRRHRRRRQGFVLGSGDKAGQSGGGFHKLSILAAVLGLGEMGRVCPNPQE